MKDVQVLDCTLRDGGYLIDKEFGTNNITEIISGLVSAKVDVIEIGFLQNEGFGEGKTVYLNEQEAKKYIPKDKGQSIFAGFADCSRYDVDNLGVVDGDSFTAVRQCFYKWEKEKAFENCRRIIEKGYKCFVQPVDIMGYSDVELIELVELMNKLDIYCFSIVDTFGSMYEDDLVHVFSLVDKNLRIDSLIGFHSHNNLQMSSALSQKFISLANNRRKVIIDSTLAGMGRGAGNTPTELIIQYLMDKHHGCYEIDQVLDLLDANIRHFRSRAQWGYSTECYLAGAYNAHVNNLAYLLKKNAIKAKDIRYILNRLDTSTRKRYNYDQLEAVYLEYVESQIDDTISYNELIGIFKNQKILVVAAGKSVEIERTKINQYILENDPIVISINRTYEGFVSDFVYINNKIQYDKFIPSKNDVKRIITSNIKEKTEMSNEYIISLHRVIKCGWENMDNSTILLLRLLDSFSVNEIAVAGFDGYSSGENYMDKSLEVYIGNDDMLALNNDLVDMTRDFLRTKNDKTKFSFLTSSRIGDMLNRV